MRKQSKKNEQFQVPVMFAFREAFEAGDSAARLNERVDGERVISGRGAMRRRGTDEASLKRNLVIDLLALVNTIDLASALDIDDLPYLKNSVINYGLPDISNMTGEEHRVTTIADDLAKALVQHEPRLRPGSVSVDKTLKVDDVNQRVQFTVSAEMASYPLDVPIEFVAEIEVSSGKIQLSRLPATS